MKSQYKINSAFAAAALLAIVCGCSGGSERRGDDIVYEPQHIVALYRYMADYCTYDSVARASLRDSLASEIGDMFELLDIPSTNDATLQAWSRSRPVTIFTPAVDSIIPDIAPIEDALGYILAAAEVNNLDVAMKRYAAVVWGKQAHSIFFCDSTMLIALNHYLGADYPGYNSWPMYTRMVKTPEFLPYDMAEALVAVKYPYAATGSDATVLSRILYEGALVTAKLALVDKARTATALGYSEQQLQWLDERESALWQALVGGKHLYDTSAETIERLVAPAPTTPLLDRYSPGRVGRYIGYKIVEAYLERNPDTGLADLLSPAFYTSSQTLAQSAYNP